MFFSKKLNKTQNPFFRKNQLALLRCKVYILLILWSSTMAAQQIVTPETINKQFDQIAFILHSQNPEKGISTLNKIYQNSKTIDYKSGIAKVGYNLAIIYFNSSDYNKVINLNDEFLKVGNEISDYENISHIHRLKGCAYSELGLLSKGSQEYEQALQYAKKIKAGNKKQHALSLIYSNLANHLMKSSAPQDSVFANIKKCIAAAEKINETENSFISKKYSLIAYSYIILANEYENEGNIPLAEDYYLKSLNIHQSKSVPLVERVILLNQLGSFYYGQKEYDKSIKYAEEGILIEKKTSLPQLRRDLFEVLSKSYMESLETEKSKKYFSLFTALNDSISNSNKKAVDSALNKTISKQEELLLNNSSKQMIIYTLSSVVFIIFVVSFFLYYKKQKQIQKIEKVLLQLKRKHDNPESVVLKVDMTDHVQEKEDKTLLMPPEAEEKLLEKLNDFEVKQLFLERKVSLSYVAAEIETNTKYLSYIIKKHKGKDFNEYINDLRISYIIQKITDQPIYRQYKINTLAEEAGFSSHSKFATVFKSSIGVSPSEFIKYFKEK